MRWTVVLLSATILIMLMELPVIATAEQAELTAWGPALQRYRPLIGGIQIEAYWVDEFFGSPYHLGTCTLGYAAIGPNGELGYVTASHCVEGYVDPRVHVFQPEYDITYENYVGSPTIARGNGDDIDAAFIPWSDVTRKILHESNGQLRTLPVYYYYRWETLERWNETMNRNPWAQITVWKTGRTTGTTMGRFMCLMREWAGFKWAVLISIVAGPHDSGSPVYTVVDAGPPFRLRVASLVGIFVAGDVYHQCCGVCELAVSADGIARETGVVPWTYYGGV